MTTKQQYTELRQRITNKILRKNFIGAVVVAKNIIPSKVALFDAVSDISIDNPTETESVLTMDYGDFAVSFNLLWERRDSIKGAITYILREVN